MGLESLFNYLPLVPERVQHAAVEAVKKAAFDIAAHAIDGPPRDTGFMKGSIYVAVHSGENKYPYSAIEQPTKPSAYALPEVTTPSETLAYVAVGANYGIYVEMGTVNAPAQPYLLPAAELVKPELEKIVQAMLDQYLVF